MNPTLLTRRDTRQARQAQQSDLPDERVYVNLPQLLRLQHRARGLSFLPQQPVASLLSGRHASKIRGRGLNFEEIRDYHPGDDIRTIDWKVTARMRSPHTRVFTEERDRAALLLVDQRVNMFYGTQVNMKSVTAAQTAALAAWRVLDVGDRVGALIFDDAQLHEIRPRRSRPRVTAILRQVVEFNNRLRADLVAQPGAEMLNSALRSACRLASHDFLVVVISDFQGFDNETERLLLHLSQHNDVISALVHDPSASKIVGSQNFVVSDGQLQAEVPLGTGRTRQRIEELSHGRIADVLSLERKYQIPVLPISSAEDVVVQLQRLLGSARQVKDARR